VIDQDSAHHLGGEGIEMAAIFAHSILLVQQAHIKFMYQCRALQHVGVALAANVGCGHLAQMRIDQRHQFLKG